MRFEKIAFQAHFFSFSNILSCVHSTRYLTGSYRIESLCPQLFWLSYPKKYIETKASILECFSPNLEKLNCSRGVAKLL